MSRTQQRIGAGRNQNRPNPAQADFIAAYCGRWYTTLDARRLVHQAGMLGVPVAVRRMQLGDTLAAGFGTVREVYRTEETNESAR